MSKEAVLELFETLDKDPDLTERLTAITEPAEVARIAESELGLNFTAEELISAASSIQDEEELNEEELEAVAGGGRRRHYCRCWCGGGYGGGKRGKGKRGKRGKRGRRYW